MKLDGIHHITCVTADALRNLDFYGRVLGLRLVKKTVNQDDPSVYHLFYADERGSPGSDITFFEFPGVRSGNPGAGMVHTIVSRVASTDALDFWRARLAANGVELEGGDNLVRFSDPDGLSHELVAAAVDDEPLIAEHPEIPREFALQGFDGVRAYAAQANASDDLLANVLGFEREPAAAEWRVCGTTRNNFYAYDEPPTTTARSGAGSVHHVAFSTELDDQAEWHRRVAAAGVQPSPIIDRFWFRSIYFREPSGVLFELATKGPGFAVDEPAHALGEKLTLPPSLEPMRPRIEASLTPLPSLRG